MDLFHSAYLRDSNLNLAQCSYRPPELYYWIEQQSCPFDGKTLFVWYIECAYIVRSRIYQVLEPYQRRSQQKILWQGKHSSLKNAHQYIVSMTSLSARWAETNRRLGMISNPSISGSDHLSYPILFVLVCRANTNGARMNYFLTLESWKKSFMVYPHQENDSHVQAAIYRVLQRERTER